jgi:hypothetical protein
MFAAKANPHVVRGCGESRDKGATYLECGVGPGGEPLENFIVDPPKPFRVDHQRGVDLITLHGVTHVVDYVGEKHYPYPSDVLEEVRWHGLSRKVSPSVIAGKLTRQSRVLLVHAKAVVTNAEALYDYLEHEHLAYRCALYRRSLDRSHLTSRGLPCSRHSYAFAPATSVVPTRTRATFEREFTKDTRYVVEPLYPDAPEPTFTSGIIAAFPITNISVVESSDGSHRETLQTLRQSLPDLTVEASEY